MCAPCRPRTSLSHILPHHIAVPLASRQAPAVWETPSSDGGALPPQVLSKTMDSTTLTTDKVELSTITRDEADGGRVPTPLPHPPVPVTTTTSLARSHARIRNVAFRHIILLWRSLHTR